MCVRVYAEDIGGRNGETDGNLKKKELKENHQAVIQQDKEGKERTKETTIWSLVYLFLSLKFFVWFIYALYSI